MNCSLHSVHDPLSTSVLPRPLCWAYPAALLLMLNKSNVGLFDVLLSEGGSRAATHRDK